MLVNGEQNAAILLADLNNGRSSICATRLQSTNDRPHIILESGSKGAL